MVQLWEVRTDRPIQGAFWFVLVPVLTSEKSLTGMMPNRGRGERGPTRIAQTVSVSQKTRIWVRFLPIAVMRE